MCIKSTIYYYSICFNGLSAFLLLLGTYCRTVQTTTGISDYSMIVIISIELYPIYLLGGETCEMKLKILYAFISSIRLQKRLTNPETLIKVKTPHIWQCQILIDLRTRMCCWLLQMFTRIQSDRCNNALK